jgi:hypothetical protein
LRRAPVRIGVGTIMTLSGPVPSRSAMRTAAPRPAMQLANFAVFQSAWFAAVLGAAHGQPMWACVAVSAAIGWHLAVSARPAREACLVVLAMLLGFAIETLHASLGAVRYASGQPDPRFAPYWMVALWGLLAIALNTTMRWLRHRPALAALIGALAGPVSFVSGVRLGAAQFVAEQSALLALAATWSLALPLLMWLAVRFDGVSLPPTALGKRLPRA